MFRKSVYLGEATFRGLSEIDFQIKTIQVDILLLVGINLY